MTERSEAEQNRSANRTPQQMREAVAKVKALIEELRGVDVSTVQERGEARLEALEEKIEATLASIFGKESTEFHHFRIETLDTARVHMMYEIPLYEVREGYKRGIEQAIANLRAVIESFGEEVLAAGEGPRESALWALGERAIHPAIRNVVEELVRDGQYSEAVKKSREILEDLVKKRSTVQQLRAAKLVQSVFNSANPIPALLGLANETYTAKQRGMVLVYAGTMLVLDDRETWENIGNDPGEALEWIGFLSFLAKSLDTVE